MGGLVFRSNGRNISFKDPIYTNGKYSGTRHLCLRTGTGNNDVVKYGLTSNRSASVYCPMKLRVDGKDAYIGKVSTSGTYREMQSQYTSREVDVTYSSTSSGGGTYTHPAPATFTSSHTGVSTIVDSKTITVSSYVHSTLVPGQPIVITRTSTRSFPIINTRTYQHAGSTYTSTYNDGYLTRTSPYTTSMENLERTFITNYVTSQVTESVTFTTGGPSGTYSTTIQATAYGTGSGTYRATSYTYKDDGYNTWYNTYTSTNPSNINM